MTVQFKNIIHDKYRRVQMDIKINLCDLANTKLE